MQGEIGNRKLSPSGSGPSVLIEPSVQLILRIAISNFTLHEPPEMANRLVALKFN